MAHVKYVSPAGWDFDRPIVMPIKVSSRGLIGDDRRDFIKTAGHMFLPIIDQLKIAGDEEPIHSIALGAEEAYGANRNGDGFPEKDCKQHHNTFVKFARFYRNHKNKPDKGHPHFGIIKASAYNPVMRRVELLMLLNREKSACERNGGFVADAELEKLARGEDLPLSMACRVPYDVCSWCNNQAATRDQYCTQEKCAAGGCADNLTRVVKIAGDIHHLHVRNPNPTWFDMSRVFRPADRIAWGAKADYLTKAAADNGLFELSDLIKMSADATAPVEVVLYQDGIPGIWNQKILGQIKLAYALATVEEQERLRSPEVCRAFASDMQPAFDITVLGTPGTEKCAEGLGALADQKIILPLRDFARLLGKTEKIAAAQSCLPGVIRRMMNDDSLERRIEQNKYPLSEKTASDKQRTAARFNAPAFSLEKNAVVTRSQVSALRDYKVPTLQNTFEKTASDDLDADQLARDYAVYKVAALERIAARDPDFATTARLAMRQNFIG